MMLSRVADALYWTGRYVERTEQITRLLEETGTLLLDMGDLAPEVQADLWQLVAEVFQVPQASELTGEQLSRYLVYDATQVNSLISLISVARENARTVRDVISQEVWRHINTLYWQVRQADQATYSGFSEFYWSIFSSTQLFFGLAEDTIPHNVCHSMLMAGRYLERADKTLRIVARQTSLLEEKRWKDLPTALQNLNWLGLLKKCWCFEAYRKRYSSALDPQNVVGFLILTDDHPRSVRYAVAQLLAHLQRIVEEIEEHVAASPQPTLVGGRHLASLIRKVGRVASTLEYADSPDLFRHGLARYLDDLITQLIDIAGDLHKNLFLYETAA